MLNEARMVILCLCAFKNRLKSHSVFLVEICQGRMFKVTSNFVSDCGGVSNSSLCEQSLTLFISTAVYTQLTSQQVLECWY